MFTAGGYKIVFKRRWHQPRPERAELLWSLQDNDGRYDTVCEIWDTDLNIICYRGLAKLHPNDKVDKVVGKKIALLNTMIKRILWLTNPVTNKIEKHIEWHFSKSLRTEIWEAFWTWIASWSTKNSCKAALRNAINLAERNEKVKRNE